MNFTATYFSYNSSCNCHARPHCPGGIHDRGEKSRYEPAFQKIFLLIFSLFIIIQSRVFGIYMKIYSLWNKRLWLIEAPILQKKIQILSVKSTLKKNPVFPPLNPCFVEITLSPLMKSIVDSLLCHFPYRGIWQD